MTTVTVDPSAFDNPVHQGMHVLQKLHDAGVPVVGVLYPAGVTHGTLSVGAPDLATGEVLYSWVPEDRRP